MGRQWERQLLLPFSFYIDAKVLLFFELAKFNLECEPHGQICGTSGTGETSGRIIRLSFAYPSLIVRSSCIVGIGEVAAEKITTLFVFLIFTSSKFFILLSDFDCISIC